MVLGQEAMDVVGITAYNSLKDRAVTTASHHRANSVPDLRAYTIDRRQRLPYASMQQ